MACGGNRYGRNCEYRCDYEISDERTACSGLQVCVPDPYGCSCTPGYKGLNCTTECDQGEFGASCTETCHCVSGECDRLLESVQEALLNVNQDGQEPIVKNA
eukprot:XP_011666965.1 PREDICTED: tyrosine-protein kinase receptor Tie-2-like [Strongylocentrotus purpuratus]